MHFPPRFRVRRAVELGELVARAYEQFDAFEGGKPWALEGGYELAGVISCSSQAGAFSWLRPGAKTRTEPIGFAARRGRDSFVIFRGTRTAREWTKNLSFNLKEYPVPGYGEVHVGFLDVYASLRESLLAAVSALRGSSRVFIAGHSLGGALATLAGPDILSLPRARIEAIYTFASPRAGNGEFARSFDRDFAERCFRIVNGSDIVTAVPLPVPIGAGGWFAHAGTPVEFTAQLESVEKNHDLETYLDRLRAERASRGPFRFLRR